MMTPKLKNIYTCFPGGKHKALTMSYDDGREEDIPILELGRAFAAACGQLGPRRSAALYQPDGVHLTALGAERVAEVFAHLLRSGTDKRLALLRTVFQGN